VGCPFTTRCPTKIRPEGFEDVADETWEAIEVFREALRGRSRADRSLSERARELLGVETRFASVDEVVEELFLRRDLPDAVREPVDHAATLAREGDEAAALEHLRAELGSVCDREPPAAHEIGDDNRVSSCHRHEEGYEEPAEIGPVVGRD
jgi:peptide/nickel transport system ATP-binding protein